MTKMSTQAFEKKLLLEMAKTAASLIEKKEDITYQWELDFIKSFNKYANNYFDKYYGANGCDGDEMNIFLPDAVKNTE